MMQLSFKDGNEAYLGVIDYVKTHGEPVSPRGVDTREVLYATICIDDPTQAVPLDVGRDMNLKIGATETTHLIAGVSSLDQLNAASGTPRFTRFSDGPKLRGAYGPRVYRQIPEIVKMLTDDPSTRQAYVSIFEPTDLDLPGRDVPCTTGLGFMIRNGALTMNVRMRSNDCWLGIPYDWWMFTRLQMTIASALKMPVGQYVHQVASLHLYERDINKLDKLTDPGLSHVEQPPGFTGVRLNGTRVSTDKTAVARWDIASRAARNLTVRRGNSPAHLRDAVDWYTGHVAAPADDHQLCEYYCRYIMPAEHFHSGRSCRECATENYNNWKLRQKNAWLEILGETTPFNKLYAIQDGRCMICQRRPKGTPRSFTERDCLVIDHHHASNKFRGLLCQQCNHGLGLFKDDPRVIERAVKYLHGQLTVQDLMDNES